MHDATVDPAVGHLRQHASLSLRAHYRQRCGGVELPYGGRYVVVYID
jgi:hypothetical protein